jgi:hypothetical protein
MESWSNSGWRVGRAEKVQKKKNKRRNRNHLNNNNEYVVYINTSEKELNNLCYR